MDDSTTVPAMPATPQLDMMVAHRADLDAASSFYDYLQAQGVHLVRYNALGNSYLAEPIQTLLAGWIGVDPVVIEQERQAVLEHARSLH